MLCMYKLDLSSLGWPDTFLCNALSIRDNVLCKKVWPYKTMPCNVIEAMLTNNISLPQL